ncbi:MAG: hypothetical protein ACLRK1_09530 [Roseburia faecis]
MEEAQIKQIIERQPLHGSALLDPRCKILLLVCIGFVSYFLVPEKLSVSRSCWFTGCLLPLVTVENGLSK